MAGTAGTVLPWMLLLMVSSAAAAVQLTVNYPEDGNYSHVRLICERLEGSFTNPLLAEQRPAMFFRNDSVLFENDFLFLNVSDVEAEIVLTAEQEGEFFCRTGGTAPVEISSILYLAASPAMNYDEVEEERYFIIETPDTSVHLPCAIQPGGLAEKYSIISWTQTTATGQLQITNTTFAICPVVSPGEPTDFRCRVEIEHMTGITEDYGGPTVTVNTAVLSSLADQTIPDMSVESGRPAEFTCNFIRQNTDFTILWTIDGTEITCDNMTTNSNVQCTTINNKNQSVLQIENTAMLEVGEHEVQCVMRHMIADEYSNDMSFRVGDNFTATAMLEIFQFETVWPTPIPAPTTSVSCAGSDCLTNSGTNSGLSPAIIGATTAALFLVLILSTTVVVVGIVAGIHRGKKKQHNRLERSRSVSPAGVTVEFQQVNASLNSNQFTDNRDTEMSSLERQDVPESVSLITHLEQELNNKKMLFTKQHLQLDNIIGEGKSGVLYCGCIVGGEVVAVKTVKALSSENDRVKLLKEVSLMLSFKHPNVMSLIGLCFDGDVPLIIMPFMSDGSLLEYVKRNRYHLYLTLQSSQDKVDGARKRCLDMCHQIAKGMSYLARNKFVHRDLAARNCMIDGLVNGVIKVADFGLAEDMYVTNYYCRNKSKSEERAPIRWMAPESIETNIYNEATDVWSFGVTCWEVLTCGEVPYAGVPAMTLLTELHSGHRLDRPSNIVCSQQIWDMMRRCWSGNPHQRPSFNQLVRTLFDLFDFDFIS